MVHARGCFETSMLFLANHGSLLFVPGGLFGPEEAIQARKGQRNEPGFPRNKTEFSLLSPQCHPPRLSARALPPAERRSSTAHTRWMVRSQTYTSKAKGSAAVTVGVELHETTWIEV